jgi:hypothetical protein
MSDVPEPRGTRNFVLENVRRLREMQSRVRKQEETNPVILRCRRNKFENVPAKVNSYVNGFQSKKNKPATKEPAMSISGVPKRPQKTLAGSQPGSVGRMIKVGITETADVRAEDSIPTRNGTVRGVGMAESVHRQLTELSLKDKKDVATSTELSTDLSASLPVDSASEAIAFTGSRSLGCQTVDPSNFDELYNVGVIKYSSPSRPLGTKLRRPEKKLSTCEVEQ